MAPKLYMVSASPPVRAVLMVAKSIGLNLELKEVNMAEGEHKTPEFLKMNPQHTVPTLVDDDGFVLWDSHAIMPYLLSKYGKDESLYPSDVKIRALVDQRLHFDTGVAFAKLAQIVIPLIYQGKKNVDQKEIDAVCEIYSFVEIFLDGRQWIAGDFVTIADFSYITTLTSLEVFVKIDANKFPKLVDYLKRAESLPEYDVQKKGLDAFADFVKQLSS